jgi:hypothetical protein
MSEKPEARARLMKLLALAERGCGGEAVNAKRMLESALHRAGRKLRLRNEEKLET